ncbi:aluminum resistance protein [Vulcanimicrobium alpinum]|uniref:Aluminum resistance protein n=1 Tax=Vulcanimicrobium alpinum TaxID=3016050 RepID=A0AAN1XY97_UNVUL|nr:methionine gamma-lyase family protein [Vulcanimicrobium alpinum]BDE07621.1 aluminum resistance protein [Vulcanimicrobium alpinum]
MIDALLDGIALAPRVRDAAVRAAPWLERRDPRAVAVRARVLRAFLDEGIAESDLAGTTGYGYDDAARERYESLLARCFRAERVLARLSIVSGTHAIVAGLDALVAPGATLLAANGAPYDTLRHAIATAPYSLVSRGVRYAEVARTGAGETDLDALRDAVRAQRPAVVFVQRSRGYAVRRSLTIDAIAATIDVVRGAHREAVVFVDNCYGELVEEREPLEAGADLIAGSLIKNIGGGLAPTGGYLAGRADLIERIAARVFAPGIGAGLGPTLGFGRALVQGLFYAPLVVAETLRGLDFAAALFAELGCAVDPIPGDLRTDIVQAIRLGDRERLIAFARGLQRAMPVNARFAPEPGPVPGYVDPVIMSSGSFVSGATIDLSCDAPLRPPFEVYLQGGITAEHAVLGAVFAAQAVYEAGGFSSPMKP